MTPGQQMRLPNLMLWHHIEDHSNVSRYTAASGACAWLVRVMSLQMYTPRGNGLIVIIVVLYLAHFQLFPNRNLVDSLTCRMSIRRGVSNNCMLARVPSRKSSFLEFFPGFPWVSPETAPTGAEIEVKYHASVLHIMSKVEVQATTIAGLAQANYQLAICN